MQLQWKKWTSTDFEHIAKYFERKILCIIKMHLVFDYFWKLRPHGTERYVQTYSNKICRSWGHAINLTHRFPMHFLSAISRGKEQSMVELHSRLSMWLQTWCSHKWQNMTGPYSKKNSYHCRAIGKLSQKSFKEEIKSVKWTIVWVHPDLVAFNPLVRFSRHFLCVVDCPNMP